MTLICEGEDEEKVTAIPIRICIVALRCVCRRRLLWFVDVEEDYSNYYIIYKFNSQLEAPQQLLFIFKEGNSKRG